MKRVLAGLTVLMLTTPVAWAQASVASLEVAQGDREHLAMSAPAALEHYDAAVRSFEAEAELVAGERPVYGEALEKASREAMDVGQFERRADEQEAFFRRSLAYARQAVSVRPESAEAHFQLARALGRIAMGLGPTNQVKYALLIRSEAQAALHSDPQHSGALHVLGMWNAEVMRLNAAERFVAENVLGGAALGEASWEKAVEYMVQAVAIDPDRIAHRFDLALIYADRRMKPEAREQLEWIARAPPAEYNDPRLKEQAALALVKLNDR